MADSKTEICNLALVHLNFGTAIGNIDTEKSAEATVLRRVYDTALKKTLRDFSFPFSRKFATLGLITTYGVDASHPTREWTYQYQRPSDSLMVRRILSVNRTDTHESRIPYLESYGSAGTVIYTDEPDAEVEYTIFVDDPTRYPHDFVMALSFLLAALSAPGLTGGDPFKLGDRAIRFYQMEISGAKANAVGGEQPDQEPETASIRARND